MKLFEHQQERNLMNDEWSTNLQSSVNIVKYFEV